MLNQKTRDTTLPDDSIPGGNTKQRSVGIWNPQTSSPVTSADFAERKLSGAPLLADGLHHVCNVALFHGMK